MKSIGFVFIAVGLALLLYVVFTLFTQSKPVHSPIPQENGVKVIFVTPTK